MHTYVHKYMTTDRQRQTGRQATPMVWHTNGHCYRECSCLSSSRTFGYRRVFQTSFVPHLGALMTRIIQLLRTLYFMRAPIMHCLRFYVWGPCCLKLPKRRQSLQRARVRMHIVHIYVHMHTHTSASCQEDWEACGAIKAG